MDYSKLTDEELTKMYNETVQGEPDYSSLSDEDLNDLYNKTVLQGSIKPQSQPQSNENQVLTGEVQQNIRQELDKKGRVHFIDADTGEEIKSNLNPLQKVGRKLKATGENIRSFMTQDYGEPLKARQKAGAMVLSSLLPAGQGISAMALSGALGSGLYSGAEQFVDEGKIKPSKLAIDTALGGTLGGALGLGGKYIGKQIAKAQRKNEVLKRRKINFEERMTPEQKANYEAKLDYQTIPDEELRYRTATDEELEALTEPKNKTVGDVIVQNAEMPTMAQTVDNTISETLPKTEEIPITPDNKNIRQSAQTVLEQTNYDPQIVSLIEDNPELKYYNPINLKQKVQDLSKLSNEELSAKALSENNNIDNVISRKILLENGLQNKNINYALLDRTITGGTEQAQAFVARKIMNIGTLGGALIAARKAMIDVLPKKTREVIKNGNKIAKKILTSEEKASKILDHYGVQGKNQKIILNKLEKLNKLGELNEETVYTALCEGYNVKNLTDPQIEKITELSKNIANAATDREKVVAEQLFWKNVNKFAPNFWKKLSQKDQTYRTINMLLSPKSRIKDYVGSALYQGERVLDEIGGQLVSSISRGLGYKTRALGLDNKAWQRGYKRGLKEIGEDVELGINTGRSGEGSRYDLSNFPAFEDVPVLGKAEKILNYTIKAIDRPFYEAAYEASLANQMRAAGVTEPTQEMVEQAVLEGKQAIFQRNGLLTNSGLKARDVLDNIAPNLRLGQRLVPFLQTIGNLTQEGINATPLTAPQNLVNYINALNAGDIGAIRDAELALGKNIKGGLYGLGGLALANNADNNIGQINNSFNAEQEVTNRPDQSFRLGNQYYSIANFPQASIPLAFYKGLFSDGSVPERMVKSLLSPINAIASLPANKTIGDLVKGGSDVVGELSKLADEDNNTTLNDVIEGPVANTFKQLGANLISQYVPAGGVVSNIRNITDNNRRELSSDSILEYIKNRIINRIPFASEIFPLKYDVTGEPVENSNIKNDILRSVAALADPFEIRNVEPTPKVMKYLDDLQNFAKENDIRGGKTTLQLRKAKNYIGNKKSNRVKLTGEQYAEFSRQMQTALYEMKNELINDPEFLQLPEKEQIKVITKRQKQIKDEIELDTLRRIYGEQ